MNVRGHTRIKTKKKETPKARVGGVLVLELGRQGQIPIGNASFPRTRGSKIKVTVNDAKKSNFQWYQGTIKRNPSGERGETDKDRICKSKIVQG